MKPVKKTDRPWKRPGEENKERNLHQATAEYTASGKYDRNAALKSHSNAVQPSISRIETCTFLPEISDNRPDIEQIK